MIRECDEHGYFRDEFCPICGEEGKFLMSDFEVEKMGRTMASILRHGNFDLPMDGQGFVDMREIIYAVKDRNPRMKWLKERHIEALVETDPKGRYQISGSDVRATYGHSIDLDLRHPTDDIPPVLYYPTSREGLDALMGDGIYPTDRAMVHLSATYGDAFKAGSNRGGEDPLILEIDTAGCIDAGIEISRAAKTVYLCDQVPSEFIRVSEEDPGEGGERGD
ncbi:MAG: RNA 2'-phosphotransferase [Candidatus Methanoplasma sp.]|jgi:putative RNA 2'-phosphotransferase|nr:RNA 2'-phosphotransferase [Candidatus Methanoplasma sp.]